jgi:hypothetical protein
MRFGVLRARPGRVTIEGAGRDAAQNVRSIGLRREEARENLIE